MAKRPLPACTAHLTLLPLVTAARKHLVALFAATLFCAGMLPLAHASPRAQATHAVHTKTQQGRGRELVAEIGFRNRTTDRLKKLYGYDYLYPQAVAVDEREGELFILRGAGKGKNRWGWIEVYDLQSLSMKTSFATSQRWREGLAVKREGGRRYLYTIGDESVIRFDITRLPDDLAVLQPERRYVQAFSMMASHGDGFVVQDRRGLRGPSGPQAFTLYDAQFRETGRLVVALSGEAAGGLPGGKAKQQAIASDGSRFYAGYGGAFVPHVHRTIDGMGQGAIMLDAGGSVRAWSLLAPEAMIDELAGSLDYTPTCIENEGMTAAGRNIYSLWVTLGPQERESAQFAGKGIVLMREGGMQNGAGHPVQRRGGN